jgi:RNA polymerase sigma-70 factor (ECF subfamily)
MPNESSGSITDLLRLARSGDRDAVDRLFAACRNYALIVAQSQVESWIQAKVDPSDLVQQSMLEAYLAFDSFHGQTGAEWLAWLRRILQHNAMDLARHFGGAQKRQISREVSLARAGAADESTGPREPSCGEMTPSAQLLLHERELLVADALARLPADYREVILLRNLQGLPFEDVARRLNRSRPATQMLWMRALRTLQALLEADFSGSN